MSDERQGAAGNGEKGTGDRGRAAVAAPLRPTGKRSRREAVEEDGTPATETSGGGGKDGTGANAKTDRKFGGRSNPVSFVWTFLKQVVAELRKVIWPNRKQMVTYTTVVLLFLAFMVTLIGVVDLGLGNLVLRVFG